MRYIDSGTRNPAHALGTWLETNVFEDSSIKALRWQTGFFDSQMLGLFAPAMKRLADFDGVLRLLIGSNDGCSQRTDIEALLTLAGPPRKEQRVGVVKFDNAYFHPKTIHLVREDGSAAAYVGSANLTANGVTSLNVEAGVVLDMRDGDVATILTQIAKAIDWWFVEPHPGLYLISTAADLDTLVDLGVLDMPPPLPSPSPVSMKSKPAQTVILKPLLKLPPLPKSSTPTPSTATSPAPSAPNEPIHWVKEISLSDAQRKKIGHQRGGITLVKAGHPIDKNTYFRHVLFGDQSWTVGKTKGSKKREQCFVSFEVDFLGKNLGTLDIEVSHEPGRESQQANYSSELHLGPALAAEFKAHDVTGKWLRLARDSAGQYFLSVLATKPT